MCFLLCAHTDVGVVTPFQIHFLSQKVAENTVENKLKEMGAIAYNPITKDIYVSDSNQKEGSIFRIKTTGDAAYSIVEPIVASKWNFDPLIFNSIIVTRVQFNYNLNPRFNNVSLIRL